MNDELYQDDDRDRTIFIEYFPWYRLLSCWMPDGKLCHWSTDVPV